jgi:hypothetical protein
VPNLPAARDARGRSACYPRSTFYPLSDGLPIQHRRITNADFRPCSTCRSRSQAPLYVCARVARLPTGPRAPLRSSVTLWEETAPVKLPDEHGPGPGYGPVRTSASPGWSFTVRLAGGWRRRVAASHLGYTGMPLGQCQPAVKVHGVFPSDRGYVASSPRLQFHRVPRGDSAPVVTPFMQVGTYPTRNFATLGPS